MTTRSRAEARAMLAGAVAVALFIGALVTAFIAARGLPGQSYTYVRAAFTDVGPLRPGDPVREASVRIGQVHEVRYVDGQPEVTLQLKGTQQVYRDAKAEIWAQSALGRKFVELSRGSAQAGQLRSGELIPADRTVSARELDEIFNVLDAKTRTALGGTLRETGGGLAGHSADLAAALGSAPDLLADLGTVSKAVTAENADLPGMLQAADTLAARFAGREQHIASLVRRVGATLQAVGVDDGKPLSSAVKELPATLDTARAAFNDLDGPLAQTESAMRRLQPGAVGLGTATPDLRGVLRDAVTPLRRVPAVADLAEPAIADLTAVLADARPLAPKVAKGLRSASDPLTVLAPYSPEVALWFTYFRESFAGGGASGHWLRIDGLAGTASVTGATGLRDLLTSRNPYPAPGEASTDRTSVGGSAR